MHLSMKLGPQKSPFSDSIGMKSARLREKSWFRCLNCIQHPKVYYSTAFQSKRGRRKQTFKTEKREASPIHITGIGIVINQNIGIGLGIGIESTNTDTCLASE